MRTMTVAVLLAMGLISAAWAGDASARLDAAMVQRVVESSFPAYMADHRAVTEIESPTGDLEGSKAMADWLKARFEPLGYSVEYRQNDKGTHVILNKKGRGELRVLILGHTDTVQPVGSLAKQPYHYDEATGLVKGPGAGDSKASVAQLVQFARALQELGFDNFAEMTFYFDAEEETGSATEDEILGELTQRHGITLSVDSSPMDWGMNTERKWVVNYELNVEGMTGHAGNSPQSSASATVELANQITRIMQLASPLPGNPEDYTREALEARGIVDHGQFLPAVSINVGVVSTTNTKVNAVPRDAYAKLDVRGFKAAERDHIDAELRKIVASPTVPGTTVNLVGPFNMMPAMEKTPQAGRLVTYYKEIAKQLYDADVVEWATGGVSIGNFTSRHIPTIDGLGVETIAQHDLENERADVRTFVPRTVVMIMLLDRVVHEGIDAE
ncbi:MAG: M20/M25/M40 family metallo-hydrolase [Planctomycetaceae bacterium]|nr:M20/M25/M40 family metallo-hydrolase [Planctomycetaceae bacterium]